MTDIITGNFNNEAPKHRGWIIGHFMEQGAPFLNTDFEVKWGKHTKGEKREAGKGNSQSSTLSILIYGHDKLFFPSLDKTVERQKEGDFIYFGLGIDHGWEVIEDSLIVTIRWPSIPSK